METKLSIPQFSLITYLDEDSALVPGFLQDLRSFLQKFTTTYELIFVLEQGAADCAKILAQESSIPRPHEHFVVIKNKTSQGRARSLIQGLSQATAARCAVVNIELATPLADLLKLLQNLISEDSLDICCGHRFLKKDSPFIESTQPRAQLERFFIGVLREKSKKPTADPLCEIWAVRKEAWTKIQASLGKKKVTGWYLTPTIQKISQGLELKTLEIPIYDSGQSCPSYKPWKIRRQLLFQSFFS